MTARPRILIAPALILVTGAAAVDVAAQQQDEPRDSGQTERVEVRLVTVDVLVLDAQDRTVPGLLREDFELIVDGQPVEVDTLDVRCSDAVLEDPRGGNLGEGTTQVTDTAGPRRIVLALDYLHLPLMPCPDGRPDLPCQIHNRVVEELISAIPARMQDGEEIMIAALTGGLRVEQPFTRDPEEVRRTLERMLYDLTLSNGKLEHATEYALFNSLDVLMDLLAEVPGPKAIVLYSGGNEPSIQYDNEFRRLASLASGARTAIYSVDCLGLYT